MKIYHPYKIDLPAVLKLRREELKLTQKDIAEKLGVSSMGISHFENGRREINIPFLEKWCELLNFEINIELKYIPFNPPQ